MARLAIVGSREFSNRDLVRKIVKGLRPDTVVVSGGARGVDTWAVLTAKALGRDTEVFEADWGKFGKQAGFLRNNKIVDSVDGLIAFWDGKSRGTRDSIAKARARGIWIRVYFADGSFTS